MPVTETSFPFSPGWSEVSPHEWMGEGGEGRRELEVDENNQALFGPHTVQKVGDIINVS